MRTIPIFLLTAGVISLAGCQAQQPAATDAPVRPAYRVNSSASSGATPAAVTLAKNDPPAVASAPPTQSAAGPMSIREMTVGRLVLPQAMQQSAPSAPDSESAAPPIPTGQTVVVQLRRDALGLASPAPLDPLFEGVRFPVTVEGKLESAGRYWVVLGSDGRRLCVNRDAVLLMYVKSDAGRRDGADAGSSGGMMVGSGDASADGVDPAKVDPAGRPALRGGPEGQGAPPEAASNVPLDLGADAASRPAEQRGLPRR